MNWWKPFKQKKLVNLFKHYRIMFELKHNIFTFGHINMDSVTFEPKSYFSEIKNAPLIKKILFKHKKKFDSNQTSFQAYFIRFTCAVQLWVNTIYILLDIHSLWSFTRFWWFWGGITSEKLSFSADLENWSVCYRPIMNIHIIYTHVNQIESIHLLFFWSWLKKDSTDTTKNLLK